MLKQVSQVSAGIAITLAMGYMFGPSVKWRVDNMWRRLISDFVERGREAPKLATHHLRSEFRNVDLPAIKTDDATHSHPEAAAWRSSAVVLARMIASRVGFGVFVKQASTGDVRDGLKYEREHFWMKDVSVPASHDKPGERDIVALVDVDYYMDMPEFLIHNENPVLVYSFQPASVASSTGEFAFSFDSKNRVKYLVAGSAEYEHEVWDYGRDIFSVSNFFRTRTYQIERRKANDHHEYILLIPMGHWSMPYNIVANFLHTVELKRLEVNFGDFNLLDVKTSDGIFRTVARVGEVNYAKLPRATFEGLMTTDRTGKLPISSATVQSFDGIDRVQAAVLVDFFRGQAKAKPNLVYPSEFGIRGYQLLTKKSDYVDSEPLMRSFMSPIYPNTFVPTRAKTNEFYAVEGRILAPRADAALLSSNAPNKWLQTEMENFVDLLIPKVIQRKAVPYSVEQVYERQHRPTQRNLLDQADAQLPIREFVVFLKAEPYQKTSDPRIITTINTVDKREYSRYIYALSDYIIERCDWYSFGKSPVEIAGKVAEICQNALIGVNCADAERMDGHVISKVRVLERMVLLAYFRSEEHHDLIDRHNAQCNCPARTRKGVRYIIEFERGSGSPETAVFNSLLSKFIDYLARRRCGFTPSQAYFSPGQFAGDDSIAPEYGGNCMAGDELVTCGAMMGQRIENVEFVRGARGVNFLSRYFSESVWGGDYNSTCDLPRALGKLHATLNLTQFSAVDKLKQKLAGLYTTDRNTPILREILQAGARVGIDYPQVRMDSRLVSWWAHYDTLLNWPNEMPDDDEAILSMFMKNASINNLFDYLSKISTIDELLRMPAIELIENLPPVTKRLVAVDDVILQPPDTQPRGVGPLGPEIPPEQRIIGDFDELTLARQRASTPFVANGTFAVGLPKRERCKLFLAGKCTFGAKCQFEHSKVCRDFQVGKCKRKRCAYDHIVV